MNGSIQELLAPAENITSESSTLPKEVREYYKKFEYQKVIDLLDNEFLSKHNNSELYALRAISCYRLDRDADSTLNYAQKALNIDPPYYLAYFVKALVLSDLNQYKKAIANYTEAIELNPNFADAYYQRGVALQNENENEKATADFNKAISYYTKAIELDYIDHDAYNNRGNSWYYQKEYEKAIADYTKVIDLNSGTEKALAYYNRAVSWLALKQYDKAIEDYTEAINLNPEYLHVCFTERGIALKMKKEYDLAVADYTQAIQIDSKFANAYYNRGLAKKEKKVNPEEVKQDFEKYLELTNDQNEIWVKYAKYYIDSLNVRIKDKALSNISDLISQIKDFMLLNEDHVTHYTSLSAIKSLLLNNSKFRISEGNFLNDPSEGTEFYNFLSYNKYDSGKCVSSAENFSPKPFIGSFVVKAKYDNLNMWRFYGKENGEEAKGCAITLCKEKLIENIKNGLSNEKNEVARLDDESDINFYWVAYIVNGGSPDFHIPNANKRSEFQRLMMKLKRQVNKYKGNNRVYLEEYLNSIAFLFKSDAYKNENEVRLVLKGIEFEKKFSDENKGDNFISPPRIYIELEPIKMVVEQITLGPKVDRVYEWASALHYSYKENVPRIMISHLPYK